MGGSPAPLAMKVYTVGCILLLWSSWSFGQSLEAIAGDKGMFVDAQWLEFMGGQNNWSIFSRTRATISYENQTDLFTGAYLNYTLANGLGGSLVGRVASAGAGADAGVHIFKAKQQWMLFGLASVALKNELQYSWFSILRYTPTIHEHWKLYTSLELFSLFGKNNHLASVQRVRLGLDYRQFQFGLAANFSARGSSWAYSSNLGGFLRKSF